MDNNTYDGIVKKENYHENINNIIVTPRLLVLDTNKEKIVDITKSYEENELYDDININNNIEEKTKGFENSDYDEMDFIPKKKK